MSCSHLQSRTGEQYTIIYGDYRATITQLGATLRVFTYQGKDIIVPQGPNQIVSCCHGQILIPFPNRVAHGTYEFDGVEYSMPINEPSRDNALHGFATTQYFELVDLETESVTLRWRVPPMEYYPFDVVVTVTYRLSEDGLHVRVCAHNVGEQDAPWALAIHPWLSNNMNGYGDEIDAMNAQCTLQIPARTHVTVNENLIPTGTESVEGTKYDFREPRNLTEQPYDDALTDVEHDEDGRVMAHFTRPDGMKIAVGGGDTITSFQVCTGTGFPPEKHPSGVAVEPQTAYANAFQTGIDLIRIKAGERSVTDLYMSASME